MSFNTGLSGLNAASKNLDVIGHNIANANTYGMKSSRAEFAEAYASSLAATGSGGFGIGTTVAAVSQQFTQGNITVTGNDLDVAINGAGFFKVELPNGSVGYTRAGNFKLNPEGNIVTNDGAKLLNKLGVPIVLPTNAGISGEQSTNIALELNLDTRAPVWNDPSLDVPVPLTTYGTTAQIFDSQGASINVDTYYRKTAANTWDVFASYPTEIPSGSTYYTDANGNPIVPAGFSEVVTPGDPTATPPTPDVTAPMYVGADGTFYSQATLTAGATATPATYTAVTGPDTVVATNYVGSVQFDERGKILATRAAADFDPADTSTGFSASNPPPNLTISGVRVPTEATSAFNVELDLLNATQFAGEFNVTSVEQDGRAKGDLVGIEVESDGNISARYSNGETIVDPEDQIYLANFRNVGGLAPINGGYWVETAASGEPALSPPGAGNLGSLRSGALEESNVELTQELVNMITAQRTYQANAQTIKTQDQVLQTLVNLR
ncbi:flagellar hook protein FlgE [Macromonas nakdongensis]|uniref:flagellar hook protein FlgE n=1 Tax=Macromonas nakdongensis TaxID=1843082 RepID=UPI000C331BA0|nr:flagellar hook protein FlgE [Macromonas nakdongensis]